MFIKQVTWPTGISFHYALASQDIYVYNGNDLEMVPVALE